MDPVVLIADAGRGAGLGHLGRTSALAAALRERGAAITAFGLGLEEPAQRNGVSFSPAPADAYPEAAAIVLDSYRAGAELRCALRKIAPLAVFSDEGEPPSEADLCISSSRQAGGQCLVGPDYACLGPPYWTAVAREPAGHVRRVLVTTGAGDAGDAGEEIASAMRDSLPDVTVALVRGPFAPQRAPDGVELISAPPTLHEELERADLVVCSAGQTLLEALATGAPTAALAVAPNQRGQLEELERAGAVLAGATPAEAIASAVRLAGAPEARWRISRAARAAVDGRGAFRVADAVLALGRPRRMEAEVGLRSVSETDAPTLLAWRNDSLTRRFSFTKHEIAEEEHRAWLADRLADPATLFWIALRDGDEIGQLRLTRSGGEAEIHVALAPEYRGRGLARPMIEAGVSAGARAWPGLRRIVARIDPDNVASRRAFAAAGFARCESPDERLLLESMIET